VRAGKLTLPDTVNDRLSGMRIGQPFNFFTEFADEFPARVYQVEALEYLSKHPGLIMGVVDVDHGLIYRASPHSWRRLCSFVIINFSAVLGALLVLLFYYLHAFSGANMTLENLLRGYVAVMIGGIAHIVVDALKQYRTREDHSFIALEDWMMWVHIKEVSIIIGVVFLWVGFLIFVYSGQVADWQAAFFVGYSIDSVIDLFLMRFASTASSRVQDFTDKIAQQPFSRKPK
jgi:hypothetical protein